MCETTKFIFVNNKPHHLFLKKSIFIRFRSVTSSEREPFLSHISSKKLWSMTYFSLQCTDLFCYNFSINLLAQYKFKTDHVLESNNSNISPQTLATISKWANLNHICFDGIEIKNEGKGLISFIIKRHTFLTYLNICSKRL